MSNDRGYAHPARWRVHEWVEFGLDEGLDRTLADIDSQSWSDGRTGCVDQSMATFDANEYRTAAVLAGEGHTVIALPRSLRSGVRSADASVSGLMTEFKTYSGVNARQLFARVRGARPQADRVVIRVCGSIERAVVRQVFDAAVLGADRSQLRGVKFIGMDFHYEWGSWNRHLLDLSRQPEA